MLRRDETLLRFFAVMTAVCGGCSSPSGPSAPSDAGMDCADAASDATWTLCTSPSGAKVCGGSNCSGGNSPCANDCISGTSADVGLCFDHCNPFPPFCPLAPEGQICVRDFAVGTFSAAAFDVGVLFASNDAGVRVRYADMGEWTGDPLPVPATCPQVTGFQLCGPGCGACPTGQICIGRSPLHPNGHCVAPSPPPFCGLTDAGPVGCDAGQSCFTYTVQPQVQREADEYGGLCFPTATCAAIAAQLPGGGTCTP